MLHAQLHIAKEEFLTGLGCIANDHSIDFIVKSLSNVLNGVLNPNDADERRKRRTQLDILSSAVTGGIVSSAALELLFYTYITGPDEHIEIAKNDIKDAIKQDKLEPTAVIENFVSMIHEAIREGHPVYSWSTLFNQTLRINHTIALKCELDLHLPLWDMVIGTSADNFFYGECKLRSTWGMMCQHTNMVLSMVDGLLQAQAILEKSPDSESVSQINSLVMPTIRTLLLTLAGLATTLQTFSMLGLAETWTAEAVDRVIFQCETGRPLIKHVLGNTYPAILFHTVYLDLLVLIKTRVAMGCDLADTPKSVQALPAITREVAGDVLEFYSNSSSVPSSSTPLSHSEFTFFGIADEVRLRVHISIMGFSVASGNLSVLQLENGTNSVPACVQRSLMNICQWMDMTETCSGLMFAHTMLSLMNTVAMEEALLTMMKNSQSVSESVVKTIEQISILSSRILIHMGERFKLAKMLLNTVGPIGNPK